jgi:hypothetical protein
MRSIVNLYGASLIAFPGEKVMGEDEIFSTKHLKEALQKIPVSSLSREVMSFNIPYIRPLLLVSLCVSVFHIANMGRFGTRLAHKFATNVSKEVHRHPWTGH